MARTSKSAAALLLAGLSCLVLSGTANAFTDIQNDPGKASILDLKQRGIVHGIGNGQFKPGAKVTGASAVTLIVKGLDLNIDNIRFVKKPKASQYFSKIKDNAPYASAFMIAQLNGLDIPRDIDPSANVTREQFAHWLFQGISAKGEFAFTEQYILLADEDSVTKNYMNSIQKLLIANIAELDARGKFRPKEAITRSEAAVLLDRAIEFVEKTKPIPVPDPGKSILSDVKLTSAPLADGVTKVTLTATAPHPGYGIEVSNISFIGSAAVIDYRVVQPDPDKMYPQHVATVKTETYIPASYKPVLGSATASVDSGASTDAATGGSTGFPIDE